MTSFPATDLLFRTDPMLRETGATVLGVTERGAIVLDRTNFYAQGGGQPGDQGVLQRPNGETLEIALAVWDDPAKTVVGHLPKPGVALPAIGESVTLRLDWPVRYKRMRMHTALHLLSVVLPYPVTGGAIGDEESRLDFDISDAVPDKETLTEKLAALIARDAVVKDRWITDAELDANPSLVKTLSVQPPRGSGRIRLVEIEGIDLQPCGGTHVEWTGEIGKIAVTSLENKGKQNRRVRLRFVE